MAKAYAPVLPRLQELGYSETEVRRHTPEWVRDVIEEADKREMTRVAFDMTSRFVAHAAASGSEPHHDAMKEMLASLGATTESDEHLLNPDAQTDPSAYKGIRRIKKEPTDG